MILLALNELNINLINGYISSGKLKNFSTLLENGVTSTLSENEYYLLEPWIQWVTVQTGKSYQDHGVFRLGDIVERKQLHQIFEELESAGLSIGAVSPFNAENRLENAKFFIPDPWTKTKNSGGFLIDKLSKTVSRFVNSNASGKVGVFDIFWLLVSFVVFVRIRRWNRFIKFVLLRKRPGVKAAILDLLLAEVFITLHKRQKPNYSHLFLNGGAHVQHHYFFNSEQYNGELKNPDWYCPMDWDPLFLILNTYDEIIGDLLKTDERIVCVTGLHQVPHVEKTYYWRPISHVDFLVEAGVKVEFNVLPRMSRDFLMEFKSKEEALETEEHLKLFVDSVRKKPVFEIDNRGFSLFVEIIYDEEIFENMSFDQPNGASINGLTSKLSFVAIKNGKHNGIGYVFSNKPMNLSKQIQLTEVYEFIKRSAIEDASE
jgi:hypothetical protein